jgi:hypothetical protein
VATKEDEVRVGSRDIAEEILALNEGGVRMEAKKRAVTRESRDN